MTQGRIVRGVIYLAGAWAALAVLLLAMQWGAMEPAMQSAKLVLVAVAIVALAVCAVGSLTAFLGMSGMAVKPEAQPRPYNPQA